MPGHHNDVAAIFASMNDFVAKAEAIAKGNQLSSPRGCSTGMMHRLSRDGWRYSQSSDASPCRLSDGERRQTGGARFEIASRTFSRGRHLVDIGRIT